MGQEQSRNMGRLGNKEDQKNNYEKTGSVPLTTPESYLNRQSFSCHDDITVQNRATPESHLKARFSCNEDITVQNRAGSGSSNIVYDISNANPSNVSDLPLTYTKFETTASKSSIQTTTSSPKSSEHEKNPKMDISYLDIKEFDKSSGCIKKENSGIAIGVSNQYNEGTLDNLPSLPKIADINNTEFPVDLARDIRNASSKMDNKSNINVSPERQFASLTLNTDVCKRTLNEKDDFSSSTFTSSRSNIADPNHSVGHSFLTPSMSEISQKNKKFPKSTPSYFDTSPLIPVKTPVNSVCSLEINKGNVLGNNIENNSNQPTHTMGYKNSEPLTYVQREINTNLQEIKIKKNLPKTGIKKHNITRKSGNPTTLTHIEKLAENIYSLSSPKSEKSKLPPNKCLNKANMYEQKTCLNNSNLNITSSLQECIYEMTNFDVKDIDMGFSLQQSLLTNLKTVNSFISVLKTCPILNEELINEICLLRDNMLSFSADKLTQNMHEHSALDSERTSISLSNQNIDTGDLRQFANSMDLVQLTESVGNVETNNEKTTVGFVRDEATSYSFEHLSHVDSQDHQKIVSEIESLGNTQKQASLPNTINTTEKPHLPPNYEEVLTIVYKLLEKGSELDISVYICRFCDLSTNTEEDANCHLSDENHIKNQFKFGKAKWHNCKSCCLNIFGTNDHLQEHNSTVQHNAIVNLKTIQSDQFLSGDNPQAADKFDSASVCSSTSNLSNKGVKRKLQPHEILLSIAKDKLNKTSESAVGLYCQICNKYNIYPSEDHFKTEIHKNKLTMAKGHNGCSIFFCNICKVDLFVDMKTLKEHNRMPLHLELFSLREKRNSDNTESNDSEEDDASELPTLSNEEGPHFDLMKAVIKIHLTNESINKSTFLGFYCHLCEAYFLDENIWKFHKNSEYHGKRINSTEYVGKQLYHECKVCNIIIIGSEHVFSVHKKSLVHQAIDRKQQKANPSRVIEGNINKPASEDELSDEDTDDDSGDDSSTVDGSDSLSTTSSNKINEKRNKINTNGIHVTGLPKGIEQKVVFESFKCFGYIKKCTFHKKRCSSTIIYRKCEDAQKVLRIKQVMVRNTLTSVRPLIVGTKSRSKKKPVELKVEVREVLISRNSIEGLMTVLQTKILHDKKEGDYKNQLIERDISAAVRGCKVHFFGSRVTGLATSESDLDVYIDFDNRSFFTDLSHDEQIQRLRSLLERFAHPKSAFQVKEYIFDARVPIIRVIHTKTGTPCDISCRSGLSVENSQLVKMFIEADKRVRWLVVIVKWWMRSNDLLGCNIFTSYASTWLVIFFLMRYKFLCSIVDLQKGCPKYSIAHWDCRFSRKLKTYVKTENNVTGFELLIQFFVFYKNFNFDFIVLCPLSAGVIPRKQFETLQLPVAFSPYVDKMNQNPRGEPLRVNTPICLQDPFDLSHNITKGVSRKDLKKFKALCDQSARLCQGLKN